VTVKSKYTLYISAFKLIQGQIAQIIRFVYEITIHNQGRDKANQIIRISNGRDIKFICDSAINFPSYEVLIFNRFLSITESDCIDI